ncbi:MAG: hypothetical protein CSA81_03245 [Acidobacteria bacterium]|nr:MAG: hypothetical protein CSA81_03245 [Acidobacteriota bacterium]
MYKAYLVAKREYIENLTTKTFWLGILLFPVIITLSVAVPVLLEKEKDARVFAVIDHSDWLFDAFLKKVHQKDFKQLMNAVKPPEELLDLFQLASFKDISDDQKETWSQELANGTLQADSEKLQQFHSWWHHLSADEAGKLNARLFKARFNLYHSPESGSDLTAEQLNAKIKNKELFAYFEIGENPAEEGSEIAYVCNNLTDESLRKWFAFYANTIIQEKRFDTNQIDYELAQSIMKPLVFNEKQITKTGKEEKVKTQDMVRQWVPVVFVYLLWIAVFTVAQMLLTNTVEEKSNRIIEVLLSSVSPIELMSGKVIGIAATGLTVVLSWVVTLFAALKIVPSILIAELTMNLASVVGDPFFLASFVVYFLLGYLFYAAILVAMGSICNSLKEAQNLMGPVTIMLMIPLLSMMPIGRDPNGTLAQILSFFPPFTPFVMMNRAAGPPETWEYIATTLLLIVSIAAAFWIAAKIFRVGILMTGKPPKLKDILQWIKTPVGALPQTKDE